MRGTRACLLPIRDWRAVWKKEANPMIIYICSSEFISFEHFFFMWDKWILFLTESQNFKADLLWIMQMIRICWFLPTQEHKKKGGWGRSKANCHSSLLCVERRAKIKHFNYCQVHSIKKQADKVRKFSVWSGGHLHWTSLLTADYSWVVSDEILISWIKFQL